jgi:hypothetical protein
MQFRGVSHLVEHRVAGLIDVEDLLETHGGSFQSMTTPWDAGTYDVSSQPQQAGAANVLGRLTGVAADATMLDVGCGTARVAQQLLELDPQAGCWPSTPRWQWCSWRGCGWGTERRSGARIWCRCSWPSQSTLWCSMRSCTGHCVTDNERLWRVLAAARRPDGRLELQYCGQGNIARVSGVIDRWRTRRLPSWWAGRRGSSPLGR